MFNGQYLAGLFLGHIRINEAEYAKEEIRIAKRRNESQGYYLSDEVYGLNQDKSEIDLTKLELAEYCQKLINALQIFANIKADDGDDFRDYPDQTIIRCEVTAKDLRIARELINQQNNQR